ncbi:MAG: SPOR domain-containing protein [Rhodobacteraceae bacterium]|nr:SPOR domain-containing protein [Paracoccaceae bacterium]
MAVRMYLQIAVLLGGAALLAACDGANLPSFLQNDDGDEAPTVQSGASRLVERDVEAPEVFQGTETGLWDGRPSLGGVWVAHPDVTDPERVIIRNEANGKFVIGALFRREREAPGPRFQVSSDAAETLGMLAGAPIELNVTALRREEVAPVVDETLPGPGAVEETSLDPLAAAAAALDEAEGIAPVTTAAAVTAATTVPVVGGLSKPFIQIGIFSVEANANNTAESLRRAGMVPTIKPGTSSGKSFWRVVVGPATSSSERTALLKKIKSLGFGDAYYVTN